MTAEAIFWWKKWMHLCPVTWVGSQLLKFTSRKFLRTLKKVPQLDRNFPQENPKTVIISRPPNTFLVYVLVCCKNVLV